MICSNRFFLKAYLLLFCCMLCSVGNVRADYYRFLTTEQEALQCRFDLIKQAETEILVSYYIIQDDEVGLAFMHELLRARQRGVRVCVLMDGNASSVNKYLASYLIDRGVELKEFYLEGAFDVRRFYHRLHDKMLLVDAHKMVAGGRNLKTPYFELHPEHNFLDRDAYIESATCGATGREHFYYMWNTKKLTSRLKTKTPSPARASRIEAALVRGYLDVVRKCNLVLTTQNWSFGLKPTNSPVVFVHDKFLGKVGDKYQPTVKKDAGSTDSLIQLIYAAEHEITLENPYIVPPKKWENAFYQARKRGVKIRLLTNSLKSSDVIIAQAAYLNKRKRLVRMGIEIWEYQGPKQLHAKTATIDDCVSIVGSYNIHNPSERFNSEVAVWVYDEHIAHEHREIIEQYMQNAVLIGPNNKPIPSSYLSYKKAPFKLRAKAFLCRYTIAWALGTLL
jgi:cardiolipin synthase C